MPYQIEHSAKIADSKLFAEIKRKNNEFGSGIHVIYGINGSKSEVVAIRFDKNKFTPEQAKQWLKNHDYKPIEFAAAIEESAENEVEITGDCYLLNEELDNKKSGILIKIIQPGWGDKAYYPENVLERDAKIYKTGTKMFWNHMTEAQRKERPEGDLDNVAGVLMSDGYYDKYGKYGAGVYAMAEAFSKYREPIKEMAQYIGVSHSTYCQAQQGERENKRGLIVEALRKCVSVDFVTQEGAGGKIVQLFESVSNGNYKSQIERKIEMTENEKTELESLRKIKEENEQKLKALDESSKTQSAELQNKLNEANSKILKFEEAERTKAAKEFASKELAKGKLPKASQIRIAESVSVKAPYKDGKLDEAEFTKLLNESADAEFNYLKEATGKDDFRVSDVGGGNGKQDADNEAEKIKHLKEMKTNQYRNLGYSKEEAEKRAEIFLNG